MKFFAIFFSALMLVACNMGSSDIAGTYTTRDGGSYTFTADGKIKTTTLGDQKETTYTREQDRIKFQFAGGLPGFFVINSDGSLTSAYGQRFTKKQE